MTSSDSTIHVLVVVLFGIPLRGDNNITDYAVK